MPFIRAVILGLVQGATEFLPVSSSGHLIIFSNFLGWGSGSLIFDVMLHLGTGLALVVYFWKDLVGVLKDLKGLGLKIFLGILPAGIAGFLFEDWFESTFRSVESVILFLFLGSLLMLLAEVWFRRDLGKNAKTLPENSVEKELTYKGALFIGLFQVLALFSGFSRSGSTISGGLFYGLKREEAARFSFLLSVPLILGAGFMQLAKMLLASSSTGLLVFSWQEALVGIFTSFFAGLLCIKFLMKFLKQNSLIPFVVYRVGLVLLLLVLIL